ncbi:DNL zinc finger-domain-containing protein [Trametes meyenii]|nr:DNL zinc finger-domain-containing protein [Trametes meyenii]
MFSIRHAITFLRRPVVPAARSFTRTRAPFVRAPRAFPFLAPTRTFSFLPARAQDASSSTIPHINHPSESSGESQSSEPQQHLTFKPPEPKLSLTFTCTVEACHTRSTHQFTRRSYEKGIVIVQCPGCKNRHLIADHLGWFKESTEDGKLKTVEDLVRAKGEKVRRGRLEDGDVVEYTPE